METEELDVLIIGAGPTGLTLALELALQQHGHQGKRVKFRIIDREPERSPYSRALVLQPRTLELLARYGFENFLTRMLDRGKAVTGMTWTFTPTREARFQFSDMGSDDTEFPLSLNVSQTETERFLLSSLEKELGGDGGVPVVERGVEAESVAQDADGATVTLVKTGGGDDAGARETVRCKYVIGADGARSIVRKASTSITFDGKTYPHDFIICDAYLHDTYLPLDRIQINMQGHFVGIFPVGGDVVRVASMRDPGAELTGVPTLEEFQQILSNRGRCGPAVGRLHDPIWMTNFRTHCRCASRYRDGRLFIAGDAAHIHSPVGGQGMNAGLQDAINLGWKLSAVLRGAAHESLLDTYEEERRPIGLDLLRTTDNMFQFFAITNRFLIWLRALVGPWLPPLLVGTRARRRRFFKWITMLSVSYRGNSSIVATATGFKGPVMGGDRAPDGKLLVSTAADAAETTTTTNLHHLIAGVRHHLVLFAGETATEDDLIQFAAKVVARENEIQVVMIFSGDEGSLVPKNAYRDPGSVVHKRYGLGSKPGYVLVRPDQYVAHIGHLSSVEELVASLG
ncbi:hypothetical protein MCOR27_003045 [Pyricularia oryzae]|uniref:FAD-binding domain-containing protein n=2 Tax=Pyricularia TaxID=48558 RepID=A0ABQ8NAY2_PYRGI|nr:hypothetical protein MCOR01_004616 [Pyricularia oryzae]KAI6294196.1 hypothetical protein MCOR33_008623 [Pyricularia grisea]KAH9431307.1 hypothetical protein MCOR02_008605 [Pyricularia oryzae]KAI6254837.1 hypothetical protein MCOR19_008671 [Pyricularia oryzae]KAI6283971.1 hypothetical protein MCOR27_003045 [Pyricularia oryzae]